MSAVFDHPKLEQNTYGTNKTDTHKIEAKNDLHINSLFRQVIPTLGKILY